LATLANRRPTGARRADNRVSNGLRSLLTLLLLVRTSSALAGSSEGPATPAAAAETENEREARELFTQGQLHYSLGDYEQAITKFRRAYELTSAPGLLFNVAQAHRLAGQCKRALDVYRHFIRLAPESEYRAEADMHVTALVLRCGAAANAPSGDATVASRPETATPPIPTVSQQGAAPAQSRRWSTRRRTAAALLSGGAILGATAGTLHWWNDGRYDDWRSEDQRLAAAMPGDSVNGWISNQQRNDSLLNSIERVDSITLVLAGLSMAAVITSAVLMVLFDR
jgi:tetratricopeptide (TPR) repeat protein